MGRVFLRLAVAGALIGNGDGSGAPHNGGHGACMVHNPGYDFNDANLPIGAAYWALLTERFLHDD